MSSRICQSDKNWLCYVCGEYATSSERKKITNDLKDAYEAYYDQVLNLKDWAPAIFCHSCACRLRSWKTGKGGGMKYKIPMKWREQQNHTDDCYFCALPPLEKFNKKTKKNIVYPTNVASADRPILRQPSEPVPPAPVSSDEEATSDTESAGDSTDDTFEPAGETHYTTQAEFNDLARNAGFSIEQTEVVGSAMKKWGHLGEVKITAGRKRSEIFGKFFEMKGDLCVCVNIRGLFKELKVPYNPKEWRLFIDSSTSSLKAALVHNGNHKPTIPVAYSKIMKESYESMQKLLDDLNYNDHKWKICADFKVSEQ